MKVLVVDIDDTLIITPNISRLFWLLSEVFQLIAIRLQHANKKLVRAFGAYDKVIILTGRDKVGSNSTKRQLKLLGVPFNEIVFCPRMDMVNQWKLSAVSELAETNRCNVWWVDDQFNKRIPIDGLKTQHFRIMPVKLENAPSTPNGSSRSTQEST